MGDFMYMKKVRNHRVTANENLRCLLNKFIHNIKKKRKNWTFKTYEITNTFNNDNKRVISNARIGALLREIEQLQWVGNGTWKIIA